LGIPKNYENFCSHTQNIFVMFWEQKYQEVRKSARSPLHPYPQWENVWENYY
jgi:hypothetical protein